MYFSPTQLFSSRVTAAVAQWIRKITRMGVRIPATTDLSRKCGNNIIYNEYIKNTQDCLLNLYTGLFNKVLDTGVIPTQWACGNIIPIYKNKGARTEPQNYRPITLLSCLGKLFTAIINNRLHNYADSVQLILENQAGFRRGLSTLDHIFLLYTVIELFKISNKKLYCAFIDFEKASDFDRFSSLKIPARPWG